MLLQVDAVAREHPEEFIFVTPRPFLGNLFESKSLSFANNLFNLLASFHFLLKSIYVLNLVNNKC